MTFLKLLLALFMPMYAVQPDGGGNVDGDSDVDAGTGGEGDGEDKGDTGTGDSPDKTVASDKPAKPAAPKDVSVEAMAAAIDAGLKKNAEDKVVNPDDKVVNTDGEVDKVTSKNEDGKQADATQVAKDKAAADAKALEGKTAKDFDLTPEQERVLKAETKERFHKITALAKGYEAKLAEYEPRMKELQGARDAIMGMMEETHTDADTLGQLLNFNMLVKTGKHADALQMVEAYRAQLYKAMGKEAPGVDLLAEFPDLAQRAEDEEISRQDAVELANARRRDAALQQDTERQAREQNATAAQQNQRKSALAAIEAWTAATAKADPHYAARERTVTPQIDKIFATYPPSQWLATIEMLYNATPVPAAPKPKLPSGDDLLRPTGNKGGNRQPDSMEDAINQGLGYQ